jgi:hypothetical protein
VKEQNTTAAIIFSPSTPPLSLPTPLLFSLSHATLFSESVVSFLFLSLMAALLVLF